MGAFEDLHRDRVTGSLFDRMIFKGHLSALYKQDGARCFLWSQGMALKDFTDDAKATTERIATNARKLVTDAGRPVISFDHVKTRNHTQHKDELAKSIAEADGITEGIICLISAVESCFSFQVRKRHTTGRIELSRRERKCLHHYLYLIDPEFGFMHVRLPGCFSPLNPHDLALFRAAMAGEHAIRGFRNADLTARLYRRPPADRDEAHRRCQRVSGLIVTPRPRACRQDPTRSPPPSHPLSPTRHDRRHHPPRPRLSRSLLGRSLRKTETCLSRRANLGGIGSPLEVGRCLVSAIDRLEELDRVA